MGDFRPRQRSQFSLLWDYFRRVDQWRVLVLLGLVVGCVLLMLLFALFGWPGWVRIVVLVPMVVLVWGLAFGLLADNRDDHRERKGRRWRPPVKEIKERGWTYTKKVSEARFHEIRGTIHDYPFASWYLVSTPAKRTGPRSWQLELEIPAKLPLLEMRARGGVRGMASFSGEEVQVADDEISARYQVFSPDGHKDLEYINEVFSDEVVDCLVEHKPFDFDIDGRVLRAYARPIGGDLTLERIDEYGSVLADVIVNLSPRLLEGHGMARPKAAADPDAEVASLRDEEFDLQ